MSCNLSGFVANEHVDHSSVTLGISGTASEVEVTGAGGDLTSNRSWTIGLPDDVTIGGTLTATTGVSTDDISERTAASGVTIDSVVVKDGGITLGSGATVNDIVTTAPTDDDTHLVTAGSVYDYAVTKTGSPANNYIAVWTDSRTLEGTSALSFNGSTLTLNGAMSILGNITPTVDGSYNIGSNTNKWASTYTDKLYLETNSNATGYVDTISDSITDDSSVMPTSKAVYDYVGTSATITSSVTNVEFNSTSVSNDASEIEILSDATITNSVYEEGDLYHLTLCGQYGAAGGATLDIALKLDTTEFANFTLPSQSSSTYFTADIYFGATSGTSSTAFIKAFIDDTVYVERETPANHGTGDGLSVTGTLSEGSNSGWNIYIQKLEKSKLS
jgi:hypothetical protein